MTARCGHRRPRGAFGLALAVAVAGMTALAPAAMAAPAALSPAPGLVHSAGPVSATPAPGTPHLAKTSAVQHVRQLVQCGGTMYAVGNFTKIGQSGAVYARHNVFSFSAAAPFKLTRWAPNVNGIVDSIAFHGSNCADAYIGGSFTSVNGTAVGNIAEVSTATGKVVPGFAHNANDEVFTLAVTSTGHLLAGGKFTSINGSTAAKYMASLNPSTGKDDGFLRLNISGHYHYCNSTGRCSTRFATQVYNQQLSHGGTRDLAEGVFTSVGGKARQQIFMLNLTTRPATVTAWTSPEWDGSAGNLPGGYPYQCWFDESFYMRSAAWSPNDSTVYVVSTGFHPWNQPGGTAPRTGLCDATAAFPATQARVHHTWINYTGCDSLYSVAAGPGGVYSAGHPRWADNKHGCNFAGAGAITARGLQGFVPGTGALLVNSGGIGRYSMSRANADDMLVTGAGLWIASSDRFGANQCGGAANHAGICFLPKT